MDYYRRQIYLGLATANVEAYQLYLKGQFYWNKRGAQAVTLECGDSSPLWYRLLEPSTLA